MIGTAAGIAWKTHADDTTLNRKANGSCSQGDVMVSYLSLIAKFGEPLPIAGEYASAEWVIEFMTPEGPVIATIYDWHSKPDHCPNRANVDWHIGGFGSEAAECVHRALWDVIAVRYADERAAA